VTYEYEDAVTTISQGREDLNLRVCTGGVVAGSQRNSLEVGESLLAMSTGIVARFGLTTGTIVDGI
jgi:hypothetical protein